MPDTVYYVRGYAMRDTICYYGENKSFSTKIYYNNDIEITTITPSNITQTSAECGAEVTKWDDVLLQELGVCLSTRENPTVADTHFSTLTWYGTIPFTCVFTNLEPNTVYHVRAYALGEPQDPLSGDLQYYYGEDKCFITQVGDWVDLGLPSGTLWATCNVGAFSPEEYGDYFTWSETTTKNIPTKEQWEELISYTTGTWTILNGVDGRRYTASNGRSLFLPAAGVQDKDGQNILGCNGVYWSSSIYEVFHPNAYAWSPWFAIISDGGLEMYHNVLEEDYGLSVRLVR